ncbi:MAG: proteasome assembly chaperone family protein [Methanobacteriota archaeon]|nr:MAG: proteasome assembly chaperone family protein [Euryarchaeota archaeon]
MANSGRFRKFRLPHLIIEYHAEKPKPHKAKLVEGLLGVGQVGLLAVNHLIEELEATKLADIYSPFFTYPGSSVPGVVYTQNGTVELQKDEIYYSEEHDLFLLSGLYQGNTPETYYDLANALLDFCDEFNVYEIYTLGGFGTGRIVESPQTFAVLSDPRDAEIVERHGGVVRSGREGTLGVTGISGLLLAMGYKTNRRSICLLGETHGAYADPKAARSVVETLSGILGIEVDTKKLEERADKIDEYMRQMVQTVLEQRKAEEEAEKPREEPPYIG